MQSSSPLFREKIDSSAFPVPDSGTETKLKMKRGTGRGVGRGRGVRNAIIGLEAGISFSAGETACEAGRRLNSLPAGQTKVEIGPRKVIGRVKTGPGAE